MAQEKNKKELKVTPAGIAVYPRVTGTPDTKFDEAGVWKIGVRFSGDAAVQIKSDIDEAMEKQLAETKAEFAKDPKTKNKKPKVADPPYSEEENGDLVVNFKMKASGVSKKTGQAWERKPKVYDRFGNLTMDAKVGGGSKVQVSYELSPFYTALVGAGVSMRLEAVRVITLVEYQGGGSAESFGFENDEAEEAEEETEETTDDATGADEF